MRGIVVLGMVVATVSGCATSAGDNDTIDQIREPLRFSIWDRTRVGPTSFKIKQGGNVTVTIDGFHLQPAGCNARGIANLSLIRRSPMGAELPKRQVRADDKPKVETWNNLPAGVYEMAIEPNGQNPLCLWVGDVFVVTQ